MKDFTPHTDERTPRPSWPAKKGQPNGDPATMPPSPLDPRHDPERPHDAPPQPPSPPDSRHAPERPSDAPPQAPRREKPSTDVQEKLFGDLQVALRMAKCRLKDEGFPEYFVLGGVEQADGVGIDAICGGLHDRMKTPPERMHPAAWRQWVYVVARRATISLMRRKRMLPLTQLDQVPSASTLSLDPREGELVLKAVRQLPPDDQELIDAVYYKGLSRRQYADLLHVGEATIRRRHDNAIRWLRHEIQRLSSAS